MMNREDSLQRLLNGASRESPRFFIFNFQGNKNTMKEKPNYYAIIPARVRYAKDLSMFQKLLFGELTALSNKEGFCWAGNAYFAKLYDKTETWISETLNDMYKKGYLHIYRSSTNSQNRKVYIRENLNSCFREKPKVLSRKTESTFREKPKHNNTRVNIKNNKTSSQSSDDLLENFKQASQVDCLDVKSKTPRNFANARRAKLGKPPIPKKKPTDKQQIFFDADALGRFYLDEAQRIHGLRPSFDYSKAGKNYSIARKRLKEYGLEKCKEFITFHLMEDTELGIDFSICLSSHIINKSILNNNKPKTKFA